MKRPILCILIPFCILIFYFHSRPQPLPDTDIARLVSDRPNKVTVKGVITDDPSSEKVFYGGRKVRFLLRADGVKESGRWEKAGGLVQVHVYTKTDRVFQFGDEAVLEGLLSKPISLKNPGLFDYAKYLANKNIYSILKVKDGNFIEVITGNPANPVKHLAYRIRRSMRRILERYLDEPDASFAKAMLIGERSGVGDELNEEFIKTGTVHILSISGLHVGLIAGLVLAVFGLAGIPKKVNFAATLVFLVVYSYIAGSSPPIIRAVIMFGVFAVGYIIERETDLLNSLGVAAFLILLWNPKQLSDPSFQLSFASIASICIFTPKIDAFLKTDSIGRGSFLKKADTYILKGVSVSVAAWIGTWPIIAAYFNIASPVSVIANLVVMPLSFVSMIVSIALLCAGAVSGAAANVLAIGMGAVDRALFTVNHLFAQMPMAYFRMPAPSALCVAAYYALALSWVVRSMLLRRAVLVAALFVFNLLAWSEVAKFNRDETTVTFLDVGQGDSALVQLPGGRSLLIDTGSGGEAGHFDAGKNVVAPYLWNQGVRTIDAVIITHPHEDHIGGLAYIRKDFRVGMVIDTTSVGAGDVLELPSGGKFFVLSPEKGSNSTDSSAGSLVGKFVFKKGSILFCGDTTGDAMNAMVASDGEFLRCDILKAPHHGGAVGTISAINNFYTKASPKVIVISTGAQSHYNKQHINAITNSQAICYDTNRDGAVITILKSTGYSTKPFRSLN